MGKFLPLLATLLLAQQPAAPTPTAAPPATDIHELVFSGDLATLTTATAQPVATAPGYDNQPFYTPDGTKILFTANRDGKQTDIYEFDRQTRQVRPVISTPESEYSATITPDGKAISVIRVEADATQRLWRFDRDGRNPQVILTDIKPVGYHAWIDADQLALFVLGKPATLQHARLSSGRAAIVAQSIGRSLHRIPNTTTISFVHTESPQDIWVKQFDPASGAITPLVRAVDGSSERDVAWTPDGMLLMSAGTKVYAWKRGEKEWREVLDVARLKLGTVTRMAVAPDGRALALVVNETP